jgi:rhodanese-related sulfurtransferase
MSVLIGVLIGLVLGIVISYVIYKRVSPSVSPQKAKEMIENNEFDYIIDVRSLNEWNEGHLSNAIHIPINELVNELPKKVENVLATILFYCKKGYRASGAVEIAKKLGYKNVYYLQGGYADFAK